MAYNLTDEELAKIDAEGLLELSSANVEMSRRLDAEMTRRGMVTAAEPTSDYDLLVGHFDAIDGALHGAVLALEAGARTREWDSLQAAMGEAWADIQRAIGYARTLKRRVPDGPGNFEETT